MVQWEDDLYNTPAYPMTDAARYLRIPFGTLRSWLKGRYYPVKEGQQYFQPLIQRPDPDLPQISFTNLVEAHVLRSIRKIHGVRLDKVRNALDYLDQQFGMPHPLARVEFQTDGVNLFVESVGRLVSVSQDGQLTLRDVLKHLLTRVEWNEQGIATRLFPTTRSSPADEPKDEPRSVSIDPRIAFGRPVVVGTRIPTRAIVERYQAGESPESIADDFGCERLQVHDAIRFELSLSHAA
ncbi:MAG: DUF433 domain-containing protein [Leptolyngbyaceae bacterium]|nr:DUF433 domain-containing protein [Leptolyngbyaceae bacterium]